ncbi:MAG: hypothetical protein WB696_16355 [Chthoniobacterales bacterium]
MAYQKLSNEQIEKFLGAHLPHRLTLLRTFRERKSCVDVQGRGDIYRCLKDSGLIAIRLLLKAMGLQGCQNGDGAYLLIKGASRAPDDVTIDQLGGELVDPSSIPLDDQRLLAGIYCRANKELAHLTLVYNDEFNAPEKILRGIDLVEILIQKHLYAKIGRELPPLSV